ncbi:MAG TPA: Holliday junction branch migration protein RuvA [Sphingomonadales bacterium]|nr:Holliday junction branch migration protein RuvA [Sphingomonadales bacterium]
MIGKLKGAVDSIGEEFLILDVGGVGYQVFASQKALRLLPKAGEACELLIETHVREDLIRLYGFLSEDERDLFNLLLEVQGVGARLALAILSILSPVELVSALAAGDAPTLAEAHGVGPKLASRIVNELKSKVTGLKSAVTPFHKGAKAAKEEQAFRDALAVLVKLGYKPTQAHLALLSALRKAGEGAGVEALVKVGLKELAS